MTEYLIECMLEWFLISIACIVLGISHLDQEALKRIVHLTHGKAPRFFLRSLKLQTIFVTFPDTLLGALFITSAEKAGYRSSAQKAGPELVPCRLILRYILLNTIHLLLPIPAGQSLQSYEQIHCYQVVSSPRHRFHADVYCRVL